MEEKLSGITISAINFSENDKILNVFTLEKGMVSAKIKGVKKAGAKLKFASEPFCFAEFIISSTVARKTVINASLIDSFYPIREDVIKYYSGGAVLEFLKKFAKEEITSPILFATTITALKELAYSDLPPLFVLCKFLISALKEVGYALNLSGCIDCGDQITSRPFFDWTSGGFYCTECASLNAREVKISTLNALIDVQNERVPDSDGLVGALKLLDYYVSVKTEEKIGALKELLGFC
jgi:DNA repair protein RecO (recombination protein O)